ncbi:TspO/MBR family protein [Acanthamoeba castellanii str. Neff]|uniref:TspO/MBR family protein n=1 Tax=Acanthamoeba castellanii (strain ATCC 30010 / Neff) TaxID=1257118 RepID=L8H8I3_ACACF|nr:TspO/MBR family protein [Acanthamoeba castellanii str. Neff]ELR20776.1 TspO/MBR family protein [Acanthamoeba castellanii str. Neff]
MEGWWAATLRLVLAWPLPVSAALVLLPWAATTITANHFRSASAKNWKRNLHRWRQVLHKVRPLSYCLAGLASVLVWSSPDDSPERAGALVTYGLGLVLSVMWSPLLYGAKMVHLAALDRVLAGFAFALSALLMTFVTPVASVLLLPQLVDECSGAYWSCYLWWLNRHHIHGKHNKNSFGYAILAEE